MKTKNKLNPSEKKKNKVEQNNASAKKKWHIGYLVIAFLAALMLWFYVADYDTVVEQTFANIPVEIIYPTKGDVVVESGEGKHIAVTVYGKKADIKAMKGEDIRAYVDVSGATKDGEINAEIIVELPNDITLVEHNALSVTHIAVMLATPTSKELELKVKINSGYWDDIYTPIPECEPSKIEIIGSSSIVDRIKSARVSIDVGELERPKQVRGKIQLLDENNKEIKQTHLQIMDQYGDEVLNSTVEVYVRMEMEKELPIKVEFSGGVFKAEDANISCYPKTVTVRGAVEKLKNMESVAIKVDETTIGNSFVGTLPLPALDESLKYKSDFSEVDVNIRLLDIQSETLTFSTEDIRVIGLSTSGYGAKLQFVADDKGLIPETVSITVRGYRESIIEIRREKLELVDLFVDFSEFASSETGIQLGQKYASLEVKIAFLNLQGVYTTDTVRVSAEIVELPEDVDEG